MCAGEPFGEKQHHWPSGRNRQGLPHPENALICISGVDIQCHRAGKRHVFRLWNWLRKCACRDKCKWREKNRNFHALLEIYLCIPCKDLRGRSSGYRGAFMAKIETPRPIRGTQDMLGDMADRFTRVVEAFERVRRLYGFKRVEVPVIEPTAVFARSLGETTDVVSKEMYSFDDRGGESITLRPEFTAGLCRAFLTEGWQQHVPLKLATHGPLFRY